MVFMLFIKNLGGMIYLRKITTVHLLVVLSCFFIHSNAYLSTIFRNENLTTFPKDIRFKVILVKIEGILFQSNDIFQTLTIEFVDNSMISFGYNKKEKRTSIRTFCDCKRCTNNELEFHLFFNGVELKLSCQGGTDMVLYIDKIKKFVDRKDSINAAMGKEKSLNGCLIYFIYENNTHHLERKQDDSFLKCNKSCTENVCNTGKCIEKYKKFPTCNCYRSVTNGPFCNESVIFSNQSNLLLWKNDVQFLKLKISWKEIGIDTSMLFNIYTSKALMQVLLTKNNEVVVKKFGKEYQLRNASSDVSLNIIYMKVSDQLITFECIDGTSKPEVNISTAKIDKILIVFTKNESKISYSEGHFDLVYQNSTSEVWIRPTLEMVENKILSVQKFLFPIILTSSSIAMILVIMIFSGIIYCSINITKKEKEIFGRLENLSCDLYDVIIYDSAETRNLPIDGSDYLSMTSSLSVHKKYNLKETYNENLSLSPPLPTRKNCNVKNTYLTMSM